MPVKISAVSLTFNFPNPNSKKNLKRGDWSSPKFRLPTQNLFTGKARSLIVGGGVYINGKRIEESKNVDMVHHLQERQFCVIKVGIRRMFIATFS